LIPKSRKQGSGLTSLFPKMKKQKSIIPSIKMPQQRFLKKTTGMKQRFTDHDRDGVISGLDCFPFDKKRHMAWSKGLSTDPNFADEKWDKEDVYEKRRVLMNADEFLQRQYEQSPSYRQGTHSFDEWVETYPPQLERVKKGLESKKQVVPVPIEEYNQYGERKDFQEGRNRGVAAKQLNMKVPVILARKKFAPWDRAAPDKPFEHRPAHFHTKPENINNTWDREKDKWEDDVDESKEVEDEDEE